MQKLKHMPQTQGTRIRISPALLALNVNLLFVVFVLFFVLLSLPPPPCVTAKMDGSCKQTNNWSHIWKVLGGAQQDCLHWFI